MAEINTLTANGMYLFTGYILSTIRTLVARGGADFTIDQHQSNGVWAVHQMRVRLKNDPTIYRLILAPENAPVRIGEVPADEHFIEPLAGRGDA